VGACDLASRTGALPSGRPSERGGLSRAASGTGDAVRARGDATPEGGAEGGAEVEAGLRRNQVVKPFFSLSLPIAWLACSCCSRSCT
jgi:hypothetical protein